MVLEGNYRMLVLGLGTACLSMMLANIITLNFTIICMTEEKHHQEHFEVVLDNDALAEFKTLSSSLLELDSKNEQKLKSYLRERLQTVRLEDIEIVNITARGEVNGHVRILDKRADHYYTSTERSILFGAIAVGALFAIFPFSSCVHRLGTRKSFTIVMLISTVATALCPTAASVGFVPFVLTRAFQGVGFAACMPVIGSVTAAWAALTENGLFSGALTSFIQLAPVVTMPMSGVLCVSDFGWKSVFYVHAALTAIFTVLWWFLYRDSPNELKCVSETERHHIHLGKVINSHKSDTKRSVPMKAIYSSISVWAVWIAAIGNMYSIQMVIVFSPTYISQILGYPIVNVGFAAALPTLLQFIIKMIAGISSDKISALSETIKVRVFNSIAFLGMATFMLLLAVVPASMPFLSLCMLIGCASVLGFNTGGFFKSATLVGRHYSQIVNAHVQFIMCLAMLTVPFIVYALTPNNTHGEWAIVFCLHAALLFVTNAFFFFYGEGVAAPFARNPAGSSTKDDGGETKPLNAAFPA